MLKPKDDRGIPAGTIKAAFPNGNIYLTLRDDLGPSLMTTPSKISILLWTTG